MYIPCQWAEWTPPPHPCPPPHLNNPTPPSGDHLHHARLGRAVPIERRHNWVGGGRQATRLSLTIRRRSSAGRVSASCAARRPPARRRFVFAMSPVGGAVCLIGDVQKRGGKGWEEEFLQIMICARWGNWITFWYSISVIWRPTVRIYIRDATPQSGKIRKFEKCQVNA